MITFENLAMTISPTIKIDFPIEKCRFSNNNKDKKEKNFANNEKLIPLTIKVIRIIIMTIILKSRLAKMMILNSNNNYF